MYIFLLLQLSIYCACDKAGNKRKERLLPVLGEIKIIPGENPDTVFYKVKGFDFINHESKRITGDSFSKQKISVVNFFFTRCPSICKSVTTNMKHVNNAFEKDKTIFINSISIDPENDNADVLIKYRNFNKISNNNWKFYNGNKAMVYEYARQCKLKAFEDQGDLGLVHESKLVLLDEYKRIRGYYDALKEKDMILLVKDIKTLKQEQSINRL